MNANRTVAVPPLTVFYDGSCRLCSAEIRHLRELVPAERAVFTDCAAADFDDSAFAAEGAGRDAMLARMHVRDAVGRWFTGPDAFEALYREAGLERMARAWGSAALRPMAERFYAFVVRRRYLLSRLGVHHAIDAFWRCIAHRAAQRAAAAARCAPSGPCRHGTP